MALRKILVLRALPSHPTQININYMLKLHAIITFCVGTPFLAINVI